MHEKLPYVPNIDFEFVFSTAAVLWSIFAFIERVRHCPMHVKLFDIHTEVTFGKVGRRTLFGTWFDKKFGLLFCKEIPLRIIPGNPGFIVLASPPSDHTPCSLAIYSEFQMCVLVISRCLFGHQ